VAQVVRRERRHTSGSAGARERRPEPVAAEALEHAPVRGAVVARHELLDPRRHGFYALQLLSHKVLRRLMALPLAVLAVTAATGARRSALMRTAAAAQGALYGLGAAGLLLGRAGRRAPRVVALPAYFCLVNLASVRAVWNVARRRAIDRWEPQRGST